MKASTHYLNNAAKCRACEINFFDIPVESIRKTRSLNIDPKCLAANGEIYKILRSNNGKKLFSE